MRLWRTFDMRTQRQAAAAIGITRQQYNRAEGGNVQPQLQVLLKIAAGLDLSPYMLMLTMEALTDGRI